MIIFVVIGFLPPDIGRCLPYTTELVAAEGGQTSGLLDEGLDQEELGVGEREESKGEEEEDDQQQEVLFDYL